MQRRFIIAGTGSGVGKSTVTLGLMAALRARGLRVQGFKCGPDYIDPTYHTAVTGRVSRNLDSWMMKPDDVREVLRRGSADADISIMEGVMGLFDGRKPDSDEGSTADIAAITDTPVVLVVNCQSMARSAAAIVKGFQSFSERIRVIGVIANKVGSEHHYKLVKTAIEGTCGVPVLGYLLRESEIEIPERHLGLVPSLERGELDGLFGKLAQLAESSFELNRILELTECGDVTTESVLFEPRSYTEGVRIAVAKDPAFHFYYPENLELLEAYGASLHYFSPLAGEPVPADADGLYIGGGFPEEFAPALADNAAVKQSFRDAVAGGMPTLAECGGFMYLTEFIETTDGSRYPMIGHIPGHVTMQTKLAALGYREVTGTEGNFLFAAGDAAKGHEFHYSTYTPGNLQDAAYRTKGMRGEKADGYKTASLSAGYAHLHFASAPFLAERWVQACRDYRRSVIR
jgi:cobyrinic acid a,c-diamide synthase